MEQRNDWFLPILTLMIDSNKTRTLLYALLKLKYRGLNSEFYFINIGALIPEYSHFFPKAHGCSMLS